MLHTHALLPQKARLEQTHSGLRRHGSLQAGSSASEFAGNSVYGLRPLCVKIQSTEIPRDISDITEVT